jgi:hypothetical protein
MILVRVEHVDAKTGEAREIARGVISQGPRLYDEQYSARFEEFATLDGRSSTRESPTVEVKWNSRGGPTIWGLVLRALLRAVPGSR